MDIRIALFKDAITNCRNKSLLIERIKTLDLRQFTNKTQRQVIFIIHKFFGDITSKKNRYKIIHSICKLFKRINKY